VVIVPTDALPWTMVSVRGKISSVDGMAGEREREIERERVRERDGDGG
jgi:hypothetical protein